MNGSGDKRDMLSIDHLYQVLYSLHRQESNCDLCLISEDKQKNFVHGFVVLSKIPKIRKIIAGPYERVYRYNQPLLLSTINARELRLVLDFAYLANCNVPSESNLTLELLKAATKLDMKPLIEKCMKVLRVNIKMETAINILRIPRESADFFDESRQVAEDYALRHLVSSECMTIPPDILEKLLRDPHLYAPYEEDVVQFALQWILYDPVERSNSLSRLLSVIRCGLLSPGSLNVIANFPLVEQNEAASTVIAIAREVQRCCRRDVRCVAFGEDVPLLMKPRIPHDLLLLFGGWIYQIGVCSMADAYDFLAEQWIEVPWLTLPELRAYHGTEILNDYVYVIGGYSETYSNPTNTCMRLRLNDDSDPDNGLWGAWEYVSSMKYNRCFVATAVLTGCIYAVGGRDGDVRHANVERYDPNEGVWTTLPHLQGPISDCAVAALNGKLYVAGGFSGTQIYKDVLVYNPERNKWRNLPSLKKARSGFKLIGLRDCLYAIGGFDGKSRCADVECYEPGSHAEEWQNLAPMLTARSNFSAVALHGRLFVCGGYTNDGLTSLCELYDPYENKWYPLPPLAVPHSAMSCCLLEDNLRVSERILNFWRREPSCPRHILSDLPRPRYHQLAALLTPLPDQYQ